MQPTRAKLCLKNNLGAFGQSPATMIAQHRKMQQDIANVAIIRDDEPKATGRIEPLHKAAKRARRIQWLRRGSIALIRRHS